MQFVGLRIPAYKFRRDAAAHPIVEHPDDSIDVGADAQNRIQRQAGMALPIVQLLVRKRSQRTIALALYDRVIGLVELVLAHYDSAASGDCHVSWSLRQSRDDFVIRFCLGERMNYECEEHYQDIEPFLHGGLRKLGWLRLTFTLCCRDHADKWSFFMPVLIRLISEIPRPTR